MNALALDVELRQICEGDRVRRLDRPPEAPRTFTVAELIADRCLLRAPGLERVVPAGDLVIVSPTPGRHAGDIGAIL